MEEIVGYHKIKRVVIGKVDIFVVLKKEVYSKVFGDCTEMFFRGYSL